MIFINERELFSLQAQAVLWSHRLQGYEKSEFSWENKEEISCFRKRDIFNLIFSCGSAGCKFLFSLVLLTGRRNYANATTNLTSERECARKELRRSLIPEQNFHRKITPAVQQNSKATVVIISARTRRLKRALVRAIVIKWQNGKRYVQRFKQRIFLQKERQTMRKNLAAKKAELVNHLFWRL